MQAARRARVPVVFVRTQHDRWTDSTAWLGRETRKQTPGTICATGSWGAEFFRVAPTPDDCVVVKHQVALVEDCTAAFSKAEHEAALYNMRTYFGRTATAAAIEEVWAAR